MSKPLKLKIVIFDGTFSLTPFIRRLVQGLSKNHDVYILGFNENNPEPFYGINYIALGDNQNKFRFLWVSLDLAIRSLSIKGILALGKDIVSGNKRKIQKRNLDWQLKRIQPDIVHVQWPSLIPWFEDMLEESWYRFVLSQRGYHINVRPFVNTTNRNYLEKYLPYFSGFHSVSQAISQVGDKLYNDPYKIDKVIYTGFDIESFIFNTNYHRESTVRIISVGRGHWKKGYPSAIRAMASLKEKGVQFHYTIIGTKADEEQLYLINVFDLKDKITFIDQLPQEEVYKHISETDVFLLPSLEEGIANVAVEAMLLGVPVISSSCGGMKELIDNGKTGWLVPTYDAEALAQALVDFSNKSKEEIEAVRQSARKKVEEQHSMEKMVDDMLDLYQLTINN